MVKGSILTNHKLTLTTQREDQGVTEDSPVGTLIKRCLSPSSPDLTGEPDHTASAGRAPAARPGGGTTRRRVSRSLERLKILQD
ncbi:hypothetical protein Y1Q_0003485 [Alligator mississippiensis]|uniref:Uncharacterized protein n=1 Tax=Alligator mississippiensis TaxID=8496 RepID=A0A151M4K4_ALLMI|nr:hypothetical protein Y1Q_0003485 [Alligator mississippiensis]